MARSEAVGIRPPDGSRGSAGPPARARRHLHGHSTALAIGHPSSAPWSSTAASPTRFAPEHKDQAAAYARLLALLTLDEHPCLIAALARPARHRPQGYPPTVHRAAGLLAAEDRLTPDDALPTPPLLFRSLPEEVPARADGRSVRRREPVRRAAYRAGSPAVRQSATRCARPVVRRCAGAFSSGALRVPVTRHRLAAARDAASLTSALVGHCAARRAAPDSAASARRFLGLAQVLLPHLDARPAHIAGPGTGGPFADTALTPPCLLCTASWRRAAIPACGRARTGPGLLARMADAASPRSPVRRPVAAAPR